MGNIAIKIEGIGKQYRIGARQKSYKRFSESVMDVLGAPIRRIKAIGKSVPDSDVIWALRDVSFEVKQGEVVGIIGRNGAGKSTLLKILSRITEPTEGEVRLHGRVGSLLEVGTGFHPELTGRENIYLNGTILGMKRTEIDRKFDEIVDFAEIEKFLDTPVKRYSSGMYVRLAFAVAAHLEPEILVIDEVLAVGDAKFQKKCLGKMQDVAQTGRTVLFVSHAMPTIQSLCQTGILLADGRIRFQGPVEQAVQRYMSAEDAQSVVVDLSDKSRFGSGEMRLVRFWLEDQAKNQTANILTGSKCRFVIEYKSTDDIYRDDVALSIHISSLTGSPVSLIHTKMFNQNFTASPHGLVSLEIPKLPLTPGKYVLDLNLATHGGHTYADFIRGAATINVEDGDFYGTGYSCHIGAPVVLEGTWFVSDLS